MPKSPIPSRPSAPRRASISGQPKTHRTSKTTQKLVVLPSAPQTKPLIGEDEEDETFAGYETDGGFREHKSAAERMTKAQRQEAGHKRITAYCVAESFKMKHLATFLKREHNVQPRIYDEALYVLYHLPLLPGYAHSNFRSSAPAKGRKSVTARLDEAEERGYQGSYFANQPERPPPADGYVSTSPIAPFKRRDSVSTLEGATTEAETETEATSPLRKPAPPVATTPSEEEVAEVIFFDYGVVVFFGLRETEEKGILEDLDGGGVYHRRIPEPGWEIEECHYAHDSSIAYPRIYNDFFTLKSRSHLLKISIAHALAQSTLLARYETITTQVLSSPSTLLIPAQLASSGTLQLKRHEALKLTGRLFKLRTSINLSSNVLDTPDLFWSEASLKSLYDAVREYMEISPRVKVVNEKLGVASDFLDVIHESLNNNAMERITRIIIWLIVVACLVELGEVVARLVVHATTVGREDISMATAGIVRPDRETVLRTLERMMVVDTERT
ncbi:hypothetical protein DL96DRAFT_1706094 [Flagelloscypha sp. PMI_526]|nr:hypothetical protein DL96DRAFT_1706094 [Flagelloscypha sp. PMI_526]